MFKIVMSSLAIYFSVGQIAQASKCFSAMGSPFEEPDGDHGSKELIFVVPTDVTPVKEGRVEFLVTLPRNRRTLDGFKIDGKTYRTTYFRDGIIMLDNGLGSYVRHPNTDRNPGTGDLLEVSLLLGR